MKRIVNALEEDIYLLQKTFTMASPLKAVKYYLVFVQLVEKKSMIVSDNTVQAESLRKFFKNLGKKGINVPRKVAKNVMKNPGRAYETEANVGSTFASRSRKRFYHHYLK